MIFLNVTITLRELIKTGYDIKLDNFDIYVPKGKTIEEVRKRIKDKFILRYNDFYIGSEVPELFVEKLNFHIDYILPYYNQLYKSEDVEFNPLYNVDMTETFSHEVNNENTLLGNVNQENKTDSSTNSDNLNLENNTPKSKSSIEDLKNNLYLSNATRIVDDIKENSSNIQKTLSENKGNNKTIESYTRKNMGSSAGLPFSKALEQWRQVMLNIDKQLIEELKDNFLLIY